MSIAILLWYLPLILLWAIKRAASSKSACGSFAAVSSSLTCDHVRRHAVSNEHHHVLRLSRSRNIPHGPCSCGLEAIVIRQRRDIFSWCCELDVSISFGGDFDLRRSARCLGKQILVPGSLSVKHTFGVYIWITAFPRDGSIETLTGLLDGGSVSVQLTR